MSHMTAARRKEVDTSDGPVLKREEIRDLKAKARNGNVEAATALLCHSIRCGHRKLAFRRYFIAAELGASISEDNLEYLRNIAAGFSVEALGEIRSLARKDIAATPQKT